jgi:SAM-dependent methyltransferase
MFYTILLGEIKKLAIETILDVGCGEGFTLFHLSQKKIGKRIEGIEYSQKAISIGKKIHPDITIKKGSIYKLPYKDKSFDLVICTEVLEHLDNPEKAIIELMRVSEKYCLLTVPNEPFFMLGNLLRGKNITTFGNDRDHIHHWSAFGFRKYISQFFHVRIFRIVFFWTLVIGKKKQ